MSGGFLWSNLHCTQSFNDGLFKPRSVLRPWKIQEGHRRVHVMRRWRKVELKEEHSRGTVGIHSAISSFARKMPEIF